MTAQPPTVFGIKERTSRTLWPIKAALVFLDSSEDKVIALVESGALLWAWDLRSPAARKAELRILVYSLLAYKSADATKFNPATATAAEVDSLILPHSRALLRGVELQRAWSISGSHVQNLIGQGLLVEATERAAKTGPNSSPFITRSSVVAFLQKRRIG
mgnify:CR=1 FL=1